MGRLRETWNALMGAVLILTGVGAVFTFARGFVELEEWAGWLLVISAIVSGAWWVGEKWIVMPTSA